MTGHSTLHDFEESLIERLPMVRGRYRENAELGKTSWFQTGGCADILYKPADREDLAQFLAGCPEDIPITVLGVASNTIIRDGGVRGVVIKLGREFTDIDYNEESGILTAGAAALDVNVANAALMYGVTGLEFLCGIPGTIGGALRMNAGAYGAEIVDCLVSAETVNRMGNIETFAMEQMHMSYRYNALPDNFIFTGAQFRVSKGDKELIEQNMNTIKEKRAGSQPIKSRTGGSTFANPDIDALRKAGLPEEYKTWQLIEAVGGRGFTIGGAQMSEKHCNFMINTGNATSHDLEALGEEMRRRVKDRFGIDLRWEIKRIGECEHSAMEECQGAA